MLVTGPCISALEIAGALSARFSVLSPTAKAAGHSRRRIRGYGAEGRLASIRPLGILTDQLLTDHATTEARILEEATRAVQDDGAEAILMGCTLEYQAAMKIAMRSRKEFGRIAARTPMGREITRAKVIAQRPSRTVVSSRSRIIVDTGML